MLAKMEFCSETAKWHITGFYDFFSPTVGYIVGLGDRHIQNILIDEQTAELVHIDLGIPCPHPFDLCKLIVKLHKL